MFKKPKFLHKNSSLLKEKLIESLRSVLPIVVIVFALCLFISPVETDQLLSFSIGTLLIIVGIALFSLGADLSMTQIGNKIGAALTKTKKLPLILLISFLLGFAITISEPDLQVLAQTVPHINSTVLLITVSLGVGFFMAVCMLRIFTGIKLKWLLIAFYGITFILASFVSSEFLPVAFDSGGVTTGPMTVPFILALGVGVANIRSDKNAENDSFGLVALCSIGPIMSVMILSFFYSGGEAATETVINSFATTTDMGMAYINALGLYAKEMAVALLPIIVIFFAFQIFTLKMPGRSLARVCFGLLYTYIGLVLFLTGVNVGFSSLASVLGALFAKDLEFLLIPLAMLLGWFIISAEPAVAVLESQIEEVSAGAIPGKAIKLSLSIAISLAMGLSMLRVVTGISLMWFLIPGYVIALILSFFVPDIYTAIAFDSGGVASGPMTATFMLQLFIGASSSLGGNVMTDAFGLVAMVAMMPLLSIQIVGVLYERKRKASLPAAEIYGDDEIIELWEVAAS